MAEEIQSSENYSYGKRPLWQWVVLYVVIGALLYGLIYYFVFANKGGSGQSTNPYQMPSTQSVQPSNASPSAAAQTVSISGDEFSYSPSNVTVKVNQPVTLTFKNNGKYPHNLTIADLDAQTKTIQPGEIDTITFTPSKTGSFSFKCTVDSHAEKGMVGTLTVQ